MYFQQLPFMMQAKQVIAPSFCLKTITTGMAGGFFFGGMHF